MAKTPLLQIGPLFGTANSNAFFESRYEAIKLWEASDRQACIQSAKEVEVVITTAAFGCNREIIEALPHLKLIASSGVGYDSIDLVAAKERGITVTNTPDVLNDCVADEAWGLLIACARRIAHGDRLVRTNAWETKHEQPPLGSRVSGKRMGIVGLGRIGAAIAKRGVGFDMDIRYHNRSPKSDVPYQYMDSLVELARWSDFLVVATVGGSGTRALIDREVLQALGPQGTVINIARGTVIDEAAMVELLESGELGGAGLDVFENEPLVPDALKTMDHVVLMPHVASATRETRTAMTDLLLANVEAYYAGKPVLTAVSNS